MQNIEFKSELRNIEAARRQCHLLGAKRIGILRQTDTYYKLADGRLKRRETAGEARDSIAVPGAGAGAVEWIFYHRPNRVSPRMSNFTILTDEQARRRWGTQSLREWLKVIKKRELWMSGDVRIHLDEVENLGTFIEFEARVSRRSDVKACHAAVAELREHFAEVMGEPISAGYSDLMEMAVGEASKRAND